MKINLPDGSSKELQDGSNGLDLAKSIGAGLAKSAVAVSVDGNQRDLLDELTLLNGLTDYGIAIIAALSIFITRCLS